MSCNRFPVKIHGLRVRTKDRRTTFRDSTDMADDQDEDAWLYGSSEGICNA